MTLSRETRRALVAAGKRTLIEVTSAGTAMRLFDALDTASAYARHSGYAQQVREIMGTSKPNRYMVVDLSCQVTEHVAPRVPLGTSFVANFLPDGRVSSTSPS